MLYNWKMTDKRRSYLLDHAIIVNELVIKKVVVDSHVDKHKDHISDEIIVSLVRMLDGKNYIPVNSKEGFSYFVTNIEKGHHTYRLVWL